MEFRCVKRLVSLAVMCLSFSVFALTETVNGVTWTYTVSNGEASVGNGSHPYAAISPFTSGAITIPSTLGGYQVTSIGPYAFEDCGELTSVTIPNSVTSIVYGAFIYCRGLGSFSVANGNPSYKSVSGLLLTKDGKTLVCGVKGNVSIPASVTSIGDYAFCGCYRLESVTIPNSVTNIGNYAFKDCYDLTGVTIPDSVRSIGAEAFRGCSELASVTIPDGVRSIGDAAFRGCSGLASVTIPDSVTSIGERVFAGCDGLADLKGFIIVSGALYGYIGSDKSVTIPNSVTSIGDHAFNGCTELTSVTIPNSVTSIGSCSFYGCTGLASMTIPDSVASIGGFAFYGCIGLTNVTIGNGVTGIESYAFYGCTGLASVEIPDSVTNIKSSAFCRCSGLTRFIVGEGNPAYCSRDGLLLSKDGRTVVSGVNGDVTIPDGVTSIGSDAFSGRTGLASVTMPNSVTSIGSDAFLGCTGLASAIIPNSVTSIGDGAFYNCIGLTSIYVSAGDANRIKGLLSRSGFDVNGVDFIEEVGAVTYRVTFGKNGGTGGDNYVTATYGQPMPTPRTAPKKSGYVFEGYWDTTKAGGKQYYDGSMKSVRNWDKTSATTLWAKWRKAAVVKVTFGKNGGSGGDSYVTATEGRPMPTPRTAPKRAGWTFGGYWDTLKMDAKGNPLGKQYYDASMKSVRSWDKPVATTLWAKWTVRVTLGKNGGTGGDNYVTVTYNQPFPTRSMPKRPGYAFGGYWVSSSSRKGQCYNADGTGTSTMKWATGGTPTIWALWLSAKSASVLRGCATARPQLAGPGLSEGVLADGEGTFSLLLDEGLETAYLVVQTAEGDAAYECEAEVSDGEIVLVAENGAVYRVAWRGGGLVATCID